MKFCNVDTNEGPWDSPPKSYGAYHAGTWDKDQAGHMRHGTRIVEEVQSVPDGHYITAKTYTQHPDNPELAIETIETAPIPDPVPQRIPIGIDTPMLILDSEDKGVGYVADADGTLIPIVYAHESPYDMDALKAKVAQAKNTHAAKQNMREQTLLQAQTDAQQAGRDAQGANSVQSLRDTVKMLAETVDRLVEVM